MQKYAIEELKFPKTRTMIENKSRTTFENLVFSAQIIKEESQQNSPKFLFFSSDYHVFRAALFAKSLDLQADGGRGGKTAMYYRVPAFIREFIAVLNTERKKTYDLGRAHCRRPNHISNWVRNYAKNIKRIPLFFVTFHLKKRTNKYVDCKG